jgi:hypothetical protein
MQFSHCRCRRHEGGRTFLALVVLKRLEAGKGSSSSKQLVAELGFVGLAVCVDLLVCVVRFSFIDASAQRVTGMDGNGNSPQPKGILIVEGLFAGRKKSAIDS